MKTDDEAIKYETENFSEIMVFIFEERNQALIGRLILSWVIEARGTRCSVVVKAHCSKPVGRGFER